MTAHVDDGVQDFDDTTSQALLEVESRRNNEKCCKNRDWPTGLPKIVTELSREMIAWKRQWLALSRSNRQREDAVEELKGDYQRTIEHTENLTNRMWLSVGCTLNDNDTRHHSGQNVVDSRDAVRTFVFYHNIKHNEINLCLDS